MLSKNKLNTLNDSKIWDYNQNAHEVFALHLWV